MIPNIVLVDIDHTVRESFWRDHLVPSLALREQFGEHAWDAYHLASDRDQPVPNILLLLQRLHLVGYQLVGLTAIPEKWRELTTRWLARHGAPFEHTVMRPHGNTDPSPKCKALSALAYIGPGLKEKVAFLLEDRSDVAATFRNLEVVVLQVHIRNRDAMSVPFVECV